QIGTESGDDVLVFEELDQKFDIDLWADRAKEFGVIHVASRNTSEVHLLSLREPLAPAKCVAARRTGVDYVVSHLPDDDGGSLLIVSNDGAPEFRVVRAPLTDTGPESWEEVIAGLPDERFHDVEVFRGHVVLKSVTRGKQQLRLLTREALDSGDPIA